MKCERQEVSDANPDQSHCVEGTGAQKESSTRPEFSSPFRRTIIICLSVSMCFIEIEIKKKN